MSKTSFLFLSLSLFACSKSDEAISTDICNTFQECEPDAIGSGEEAVYDDLESCVAQGIEDAPSTDEDCSKEHRELQVCISEISSCSDWELYWNSTEGTYPCSSEEDLYWECLEE